MNPPTFSFPQVALEFMNRDHAEFADLCRELLGELSSADFIEPVTHLLDKLLLHTQEHFAAEERVMQECGFPPYPVHKGEHDRVLANMSAQIQQWRMDHNVTALREWIENSVVGWFTSHISTMDLVTADFAHRNQAICH